jgi:uncharacterized protein YqfB (UPF0267 family)
MQIINFSYNWNNKLQCNYFTTLRLLNHSKYQLGKTVEIYLNGVKQFNAEIINTKEIYFENLNSYIAGIDTGYSLNETKNILLKMYPNVDFTKQSLMLILLKKIKQ